MIKYEKSASANADVYETCQAVTPLYFSPCAVLCHFKHIIIKWNEDNQKMTAVEIRSHLMKLGLISLFFRKYPGPLLGHYTVCVHVFSYQYWWQH